MECLQSLSLQRGVEMPLLLGEDDIAVVVVVTHLDNSADESVLKIFKCL